VLASLERDIDRGRETSGLTGMPDLLVEPFCRGEDSEPGKGIDEEGGEAGPFARGWETRMPAPSDACCEVVFRGVEEVVDVEELGSKSG
jgi:hypothetical protein